MKKVGMVVLGGVTAVAAAGITVWASKKIEKSAKAKEVVETVEDTVEEVVDEASEAVEDIADTIKETSEEIKEILGDEDSEAKE